MPRFHFQIRTDSHVLLSDATELPDLEAARVEASIRVAELLRRHAGQIWVDEEWRVDVTDEVGLILFVLHLSAMRTAATGRRPDSPATADLIG